MRNLISKCWLKTSRWHKNSPRCRSADLFRACGENQNPPLGLVFPRDVERASGRQGNPAWGNPALWPLPSAAAHTWVATSWVFWGPGLLKIVPAFNLLFSQAKNCFSLWQRWLCPLKMPWIRKLRLGDLSLSSDSVADYFLGSLW